MSQGSERKFYKFPESSHMTGDGVGGVRILSLTDADEGSTEWWL